MAAGRPSLPKPWVGVVDGKTGCPYFWNPETHVSQYEKPVDPSTVSSQPSHIFDMAAASVQYEPADPLLPKPWIGLFDGKTGCPYFWNPETNVTQYERPVDPSTVSSQPSHSFDMTAARVQYAPADPLLPKPWIGLFDGKTGCPYFWNPETNVTQYERPVDPSTGTVCTSRPFTQYERPVDPSIVSSHPPHNVHKPIESKGAETDLSVEAYRRHHEIRVTGGNVPYPFISFQATGFPSEILRKAQYAGFSAPTPIQAQSWPIALQGRDIVAIAKKGSGKTLGYLIPGFIHLNNNPKLDPMAPIILVLSPTGRLALQIQDEAVKFGRSSGISCACLHEGAPKGPQCIALKRGVDVVVATPDRLNDLLEMKRVNLHQISYLVLDDADRMLSMGFEPQIRKIVKEVPSSRQTLMYTTTCPKEVSIIALDLLSNHAQVYIGNAFELVANKSITQHVEVLSSEYKECRLMEILELESQNPGSKIIIFCEKKKTCEFIAHKFKHLGAAAIHGDITKLRSDFDLSQFCTGSSTVFVATDDAASVLDIKEISVVVNYDFPKEIGDYAHIIGRTGWAGTTGVAYTFFCDQDARHASELIRILERTNQNVPDEFVIWRHLVSTGIRDGVATLTLFKHQPQRER